MARKTVRTIGQFERILKSRIQSVASRNLFGKIIYITEEVGLGKTGVTKGATGKKIVYHYFDLTTRNGKIITLISQKKASGYEVGVALNNKEIVFAAKEEFILENDLGQTEKLLVITPPDKEPILVATYIPGEWERFIDPISIQKLVGEERRLYAQKLLKSRASAPLCKKDARVLDRFGLRLP